MRLQKAVGIKVSKLLIERNMSAYALSQKSGLTKQAISNIINEKYSSIKFDTIIKLANGFDMDLKTFVDDEVFKKDNLEIE